MELVTIRQMRSADSYAINQLGIPEETLMKNAASALVSALQSRFRLRGCPIAIFCGPGNNGGDGWAAASMLHELGANVRVFADVIQEKGSSSGNRAYEAMDKGIVVMDEASDERLKNHEIAIDALFGTGLSRDVDGRYLEYIKRLNDFEGYVVSADVPSGIMTDEGIPGTAAVRADLTVCFGRPKISLFSEPGFEYAGEVIFDDIAIPREAYGDFQYSSTDEVLARKLYRKRDRTGFKGNYGKILLVAGSPGMTGAAGLCADAAFRSGAGLVYLAVPESRKFEYESLVREAISIPVPDDGHEYVSGFSADDVARTAKDKTAVVIGPGLHDKSRSNEIFEAVAKKTEATIILDARALLDIAGEPGILELAAGRTIVTPHPGEMSRLTGRSVREIQLSRIRTSEEFARRYNTVVLLKGHRTIVTDGRNTYFNTTGNPGMATAGSGDVLCGVIASALAYTESLVEAAAAGAFIHGKAGDAAASRLGEHGMKSGDIIDELPGIIKTLAGV
ncbi:MAG TPA: NAD(P)H-hydrate dehydratase [Clostridia bacterium]|nr:NAD(P)H-hydrate dehydratase [Clostridia bacterium]